MSKTSSSMLIASTSRFAAEAMFVEPNGLLAPVHDIEVIEANPLKRAIVASSSSVFNSVSASMDLTKDPKLSFVEKPTLQPVSATPFFQSINNENQLAAILEFANTVSSTMNNEVLKPAPNSNVTPQPTPAAPNQSARSNPYSRLGDEFSAALTQPMPDLGNTSSASSHLVSSSLAPSNADLLARLAKLEADLKAQKERTEQVAKVACKAAQMLQVTVGIAQKAIAQKNTEMALADAAKKAQADANLKHKEIMDEVHKQSLMVREKFTEITRQQKDYTAARERQNRDQENARKEIAALKQHQAKMADVFKKIREFLVCPICTEVAILPKVLGNCGHIACQNCLKQLDEVAKKDQPNAANALRRCPLCRVEIVGQAFPVLPLRDVASFLIGNGYIEVADQAAVRSHINANSINYDKESAESRHLGALQLGCYAQSQLAQHSVNGVLAKVTREQWIGGVYVLFEAAVTRVFFETFSTYLHGKAGGLNVLVNTSQRMLAVQLVPKTEADKEIEKKSKAEHSHPLIKVATDGRFVITKTPLQPPAPANANAAAAVPAPVNPNAANNAAAIVNSAAALNAANASVNNAANNSVVSIVPLLPTPIRVGQPVENLPDMPVVPVASSASAANASASAASANASISASSSAANNSPKVKQ